MDENEILEWMRLGLDITDVSDSFGVSGKTIPQVSLRDLNLFMSMESALKVTKVILKASERTSQNIEVDFAEVSKKDDLQPIEQFFEENSLNAGSVEESISSAFGDKFDDKLKEIKKTLKEEKCVKTRKELGLSKDEMLAYEAFSESLKDKEHANKIFGPFITRTSAGFMKSKDFFVRVLRVLRKLPGLEGIYEVRTKSIGDFEVGETYAFPSFARGTISKEGGKKEEGNYTTLLISGKTTRGHVLGEGKNNSTFFNFT